MLNIKTTKALWLKLLFLCATLGGAFSAHAYYDPGAQRWLNRDPIGEDGGINLYSFANNAPSQLIDPDGLRWFNDLMEAICMFVPGCFTEEEYRAINDGINDGINQVCGIRKGERGRTRPGGSDNPYKHYRDHPTDPNKVIYTDPDGKKIEKPRPPDLPPRPRPKPRR